MIARTDDLRTCHALRRAVFIAEQGVSEAEEWDGLDDGAVHLLARDADGRPVGTARLRVEGDTGHIGRVCVLADARRGGLGAALVREALSELRALGASRATLGAQCQALRFYEKLGFAAHGPVYDDAGIPHRQMARAL